MATTDALEADADSRLRQVTATLTPDSRFPVPQSDGYSVYSALLSLLSEVDEDVGASVHDSPMGGLHCSGLQGRFGESDRAHHKLLLPGETYDLSLGIIHPDDAAVFQALVNALVLENVSIDLSHGSLAVERFESENTTHAALLERADAAEDPAVRMDFQTATCIEVAEGVTTMFPSKEHVFRSLLGKWNRTCPADLELDLDPEALQSSVIEKPRAETYRTHSVLVNRVRNEDGENRNIFRQGFTGEVTYDFKGASESVENALVALGLFGGYSGVGSAVARGCGSVGATIQ